MSQKRFHLLCRLLTTWDQQCSTGDSVVYDRVEINTVHDILITNFGLPLTGCIGFIWNSLCTSGTSVNKKKHTMNPEPCQCLTSENKKCSEFFRECFYNCVWYVIRWGIKSFMYTGRWTVHRSGYQRATSEVPPIDFWFTGGGKHFPTRPATEQCAEHDSAARVLLNFRGEIKPT